MKSHTERYAATAEHLVLRQYEDMYGLSSIKGVLASPVPTVEGSITSSCSEVFLKIIFIHLL